MFTITKLSLVGCLIILITIAAKMFGILDNRYADIIMYCILIMQAILLLILITIMIMAKKKKNGIRIVRYQLHDTLIKGETNIIPENVSPTNPRKPALFKIFLEIENITDVPDIGISKMSIGKVVPNIKDHIVNIDSGLLENHFIFHADIIVEPGEKLNFQIKKDTLVKLFFLGEVYIP